MKDYFVTIALIVLVVSLITNVALFRDVKYGANVIKKERILMDAQERMIHIGDYIITVNNLGTRDYDASKVSVELVKMEQ